MQWSLDKSFDNDHPTQTTNQPESLNALDITLAQIAGENRLQSRLPVLLPAHNGQVLLLLLLEQVYWLDIDLRVIALPS